MAPNFVGACLAVVRWTPVVFITAVIVWSYYAYVLEMCIFTVESKAETALYLLLYHPLLIMFIWSYYQTIFTSCGDIPKQFYLSVGSLEEYLQCESDAAQREMLDRFSQNLPIQCRTGSGAIRFCEKCKAVKPDRAHHCSVCGRCVLKMDHHCPWVNNCVCYNNYKFFVQFLGYALLYCIFVAVTSLQYFVQFWTQHGTDQGMSKFHILFVFFASVMFAISLVSLFGYHLYLTAQNRSTLESFRAPIFRSGPDKDGFSLGAKCNFIEIFGEDKKKWFLPIFSSCGDGISFPTRVVSPPPPNNYNSMEQPPPSFGDGVNYPVRTVDEDYDSLLGQRQRWAEEGDADHGPAFDNETMNANM